MSTRLTLQQEYLLHETYEAVVRGWACTPLRGKCPTREGWQHEVPIPRAPLLDHVQAGENVGVRTGACSGIAVIDVGRDADQTTMAWRSETVRALTGNGGVHCYYQYVPGLNGRAVKLAPHVEMRGDGGLVVLPGSTHPDTGELYVWEPGYAPGEIPMAPFPVDLLSEKVRRKLGQMLQTPHPSRDPNGRRVEKAILAALEGEAATMRACPDGERHACLNKAAYKLGGYAHLGLDRDTAYRVLAAAAAATGLSARDIDRQFSRGWAAGAEKPRNIPDRPLPPLPRGES